MSSAWEILEKQSKGKVDDAAAWEAKFSRLSVEKAKAEQKYFSTMREREALEADRKAANRSIQQQTLLISKMTEAQDTLTEEIKAARALSVHRQQFTDEQQQRANDLERELNKLRSDHEQKIYQASFFKTRMEAAESEAEKVRQSARRLEDEVAKAKKAADKDLAKNAPASSAPSHREEELQIEIKQLMTILRCSTCNHELRTHVLVKCMHTFCKTCIDSRLTTRQRKCPACNLKFQDSDVQALYFQ